MNPGRPEAPAERVVAVVVAYNRRDLLQCALDGLAAQSRRVDRIVVVDNASTDGSGDVARDHPAAPDVVSVDRNTGGAGGFAIGLAHALVTLDAEFVWLMDDDTVPTATALEALLTARRRYPGNVTLLGSRAVWVDGRDHPMNTPRRRPFATRRSVRAAAAAGGFPVRSSSFVSMLVDARAVRRLGLPVADYFLWNDDFEYSLRLLRRGVGLHVPGSIVEHRTRTFGGSDVDPGERFYFEVRNKIWLFLSSRALGPVEGTAYAGSTLLRWARMFARSADRPTLWRAGRRGLREALGRRPRPSAVALAGFGDVTREVATIEQGAGRA